MEENDQPEKKRRRLCPHCNQMLAKTTYWEHQKRYGGTSSNYVIASMEGNSSDSEFELDNDTYMVNDFGLDNHGISHGNELQNEHEADEGRDLNVSIAVLIISYT